MTEEREAFWDMGSFVVITDSTKPAMKMTIGELRKRGKTVQTIELSQRGNALEEVSKLPDNLEAAVIGITKAEPADFMKELEKKGIQKFWIHWRTETSASEQICTGSQAECVTGRCPMMYMGKGMSIHGFHRSIAKMTGKY